VRIQFVTINTSHAGYPFVEVRCSCEYSPATAFRCPTSGVMSLVIGEEDRHSDARKEWVRDHCTNQMRRRAGASSRAVRGESLSRVSR
jgi:hypothetical protein